MVYLYHSVSKLYYWWHYSVKDSVSSMATMCTLSAVNGLRAVIKAD